MQNIRYLSRGEGPPVLLLHGFCESSQLWIPFVDLLPSGFEYLIPEIPGFGKTELPEESFTLDSIAADILFWLKDAGKLPFTVLGHSMGGYIALALAKQAGELCQGIGLIHSTAAADSPEKKENRTKSVEFIRQNGTDPFFRTFIPSLYHKGGPWEKSVREMVLATKKESVIQYTLAMRDRPDQREFISRYPGKMLFLAGERDSFIPADSLKEQAALAGDSTFVLLSDIGHLSMREAPEQCAQAIGDFLRS